MSATEAVQQAISDLLRGNATLRALLADHAYAGSPTVPAIYDHVPQPAAPETATAFPYVVIGEMTVAEFDTDEVDGQEHTIVLHVWDKRRGRKRLKQVIDALYNALHNVSLTVSGQHALFCFFDFSETIPDPDPLVQHGVIRFRIVTQES